MFSSYILILFLCEWNYFFFLRKEKSTTEVVKTFDKFSLFPGIKINNAQCEIAGISVKKGSKMALCGMDCIDLREDVIKILGT